MGASYEYAEEVHLTVFVRGDAPSPRPAARDAEGGGAGADLGWGSGASRSVCIAGVLLSGCACAYGDGACLLVVQQSLPFLTFVVTYGRRWFCRVGS